MRRPFRVYRSGFEDKVRQQLDAAGVKYEYEPFSVEWIRKITSGICLSCGDRGVGQRCDYTPDFVCTSPSGKEVWLEVKGYLDGPDRTKLRAIKEQHPDKDLRLVFQRDNIIKGTKNKTRYSEWATKYGFKWAIKEVPKEWIKFMRS